MVGYVDTGGWVKGRETTLIYFNPRWPPVHFSEMLAVALRAKISLSLGPGRCI